MAHPTHPPARGKAAHITVYEKSDAVGGRGRAAYRGGEGGGVGSPHRLLRGQHRCFFDGDQSIAPNSTFVPG